MDDGKTNGKRQRENSVRELQLEACAMRTPPPRSWVVQSWIPRGAVTLFAGRGGLGKSMLAQQIATAVCANRDFLGAIEEPGSALYLACEEDADELWRRQDAICRAMAIPMRSLAGDLLLDARSGLDSTLCAWHHGEIGPTAFLDDVREVIETRMLHPQLLIIDNIAHTFNAGEHGENDRNKVARFLGLLSRMSIDYGIGTLLIGHPGKGVESEYSGSTAWNDLVRSRMWLKRADKFAPLRLVRPKGNYAAPDDDGLELEWRDGTLLEVDHRETPSQALQRAAKENEAEALVTRAVIYFTAREEATSEKTRASNYLPRLMLERGKGEGFTRDELHGALLRLLDADKLRAGQELPWKWRNRMPATGLALNGVRSGANDLAGNEQAVSSDGKTTGEQDDLNPPPDSTG